MEVIYEDNHIIAVNKTCREIVQGDKKIFTAMEAFQALDEAAQKQQPLKVKATIAPLFSL